MLWRINHDEKKQKPSQHLKKKDEKMGLEGLKIGKGLWEGGKKF